MSFTIPNKAQAAFPEQAALDNTDIQAIIAGTNTQGVQSGGAVTPANPPTFTLHLQAGRLSVYDSGGHNEFNNQTFTVPTPDTTYDRRDIIVSEPSNNYQSSSYITGTPAPNPVKPPIPNTSPVSVIQAEIYVPANATSIGSGNIVDKRVPPTPSLTPQSVITSPNNSAAAWPYYGVFALCNAGDWFAGTAANDQVVAVYKGMSFWTGSINTGPFSKTNITNRFPYVPTSSAPPAPTSVTLTSGTAWQNTLSGDAILRVPVTYSPLSTAAATIAVGVGSTATPTQVTEVSIPAAGPTGMILTTEIKVPHNYYLLLTATNASLSTALATIEYT